MPESKRPHAMSREKFGGMFTADRPVLFNYHGYPTELQGLLFGQPAMDRMDVGGYIEEGSTTTPFNMMLVNRVSRFDLARKVLRAGAGRNGEVKGKLEGLLREVKGRVEDVKKFIFEHGKTDDIYKLPRFS
ncbi:Xylulose 5-phosphate/Fructose 6-phosphate phosphoketolase [Corynascus novoguineensis]|uniref:Xylulose 5-phosphate/Fructose 6-phosphate phosphoketolase n=1 Tax=Corynascus novoguineensis TaxID=1126955 RepID=A0AAN7CQY4_9PEZI|nr:Xylulose 5-phosphate/Fructose 6-phosphate phosphoketolase [Corynascus novoguineensis]